MITTLSSIELAWISLSLVCLFITSQSFFGSVARDIRVRKSLANGGRQAAARNILVNDGAAMLVQIFALALGVAFGFIANTPTPRCPPNCIEQSRQLLSVWLLFYLFAGQLTATALSVYNRRKRRQMQIYASSRLDTSPRSPILDKAQAEAQAQLSILQVDVPASDYADESPPEGKSEKNESV